MSSTRLLSCTTQSKSVYCFMQCDLLDSHVEVGDLFIVSKTNKTEVVGKLIDVSISNDVCVDEIDMDGENYFFLDNSKDDSRKFCGLLQFWKPVDPSKIGYDPLSAVDKYKLKGISKLVE